MVGTTSVPNSGPIRVDCRGTSGPVALRRIEAIVKRIRRGARALLVRVDATEVLDVLLDWSSRGGAPVEVALAGEGIAEIRIYLLPREFDEHPLVAWRPALFGRPVALAS
jgi:hypothetical protein